MDRGDLPLAVGLLPGFSSHVPDNLVDLIVLELVEDAVRCDQSVVEVVYTALLMGGLWLTSDHASESAEMRKFSLAITESSTDGEPSWEDTIRSNEGVFFLVTVLFLRQCLLPDLLCRSRWHTIFHHCLSLVDVATVCLNTIEFTLI